MSSERGRDDVYKKVYKFFLECGKETTQRHFAISVLANFHNLCPYDQGLIYFMDANGKVYDHYLLGLDEYWSKLYLEYYDKTAHPDYSVTHNTDSINPYSKKVVNVVSWHEEAEDEFTRDYINARKLKYTCSIHLFDLHDNCRTLICMDRLRNNAYIDDEIQYVRLAFPLLNQLNQKFYLPMTQASWHKVNRIGMDQELSELKLTAREKQVANMLCQGISPSNIGKNLHITTSTTYKHIAHIYEKMNVSNKQELIVKLLG